MSRAPGQKARGPLRAVTFVDPGTPVVFTLSCGHMESRRRSDVTRNIVPRWPKRLACGECALASAEAQGLREGLEAQTKNFMAASNATRAARAEAEALAFSLATIRDMPVPEQDNMVAANMRLVAARALRELYRRMTAPSAGQKGDDR